MLLCRRWTELVPSTTDARHKSTSVAHVTLNQSFPRSFEEPAVSMIAQQLLNALVVGSVYALFALGFTLIFGVHHILNRVCACPITLFAFGGCVGAHCR